MWNCDCNLIPMLWGQGNFIGSKEKLKSQKGLNFSMIKNLIKFLFILRSFSYMCRYLLHKDLVLENLLSSLHE